MLYTVRIKRRFFPGFKSYRVKGHTNEILIQARVIKPDGTNEIRFADIPPRLVLTLANDDVLVISDITKRDWMVKADFKQLQVREMAKEHPPAAAEAAASLQPQPA